MENEKKRNFREEVGAVEGAEKKRVRFFELPQT